MFSRFRFSSLAKLPQVIRQSVTDLNVPLVPLMIGSGVVLLGVDLIVLVLRALGMSKGDAIYVGILLPLVLGWWLFKRSIAHRQSEVSHGDSDEYLKGK